MSYISTISKITKEEISTLPIEEFPGHIVVVDKPEQVEGAVRVLTENKLVGFDTETKPNFSKNQHHKVSLIQISADNVCYLFRLNCLGGIPEALAIFLSDKAVTKIGLSLLDDFHAIRERKANIELNSFIDLQKVAPSYGIEDASLQKIYAILFSKKISKRARLSNWEADILTDAQQKYAALDAWACLHIHQFLKSEPS